jgi:hypothetical protein
LNFYYSPVLFKWRAHSSRSSIGGLKPIHRNGSGFYLESGVGFGRRPFCSKFKAMDRNLFFAELDFIEHSSGSGIRLHSHRRTSQHGRSA